MGLSAEELSAETLYPGDTIEYFSMARLGRLPAPRLRGTKRIRFVNAGCNKWQAFVNGDPRGHREAKVLQVLRDEPEYPLRLESQEMCGSRVGAGARFVGTRALTLRGAGCRSHSWFGGSATATTTRSTPRVRRLTDNLFSCRRLVAGWLADACKVLAAGDWQLPSGARSGRSSSWWAR